MNSKLFKVILTLSIGAAAASDAWAACSPGSPRPGINYKGVVDNAVVEFSIETGVGNKLGCVLDGRR